MCRVLAYLGEPVPMEDLLYATDGSLLRQVYDSEHLRMLNLGGFGMAAWVPGVQRQAEPVLYRTRALPTFDRNLHSLARQLEPTALLAHIRGVPYADASVVEDRNVHPFAYQGAPFVLAMNGTLGRFDEMRFDLLKHIRPEFARQIEGTTDTEWVYALALSQLAEDGSEPIYERVGRALTRALQLLQEARAQRAIAFSSPINLLASDGTFVVAVRQTFDYGWYENDDPPPTYAFDFVSLWFTTGGSWRCADGEWLMEASTGPLSLIVASEPLTKDPTSWLEVPEYSMLTAWREGGQLQVVTRELEV